MRRALVVAGLTGGVLLAAAPAASAHPLGNFTVNYADRVVVRDSGVQVQHAVDTAEIPTLQLQQSAGAPDADHDGRTTAGELSAYAARACASTAGVLRLTVDGAAAPLSVGSSEARLLPGQAGLSTSRLDCTFTSDRAPRSRVELQDPTSAGRTGWKEISATSLCGSITGGPPSVSPSAMLTSYPQDLLTSPPQVTSASFGVTGGGACRADASRVPEPTSVLPRGVDRLTSSYTSFVGRQHLTLPVALVALLLSVLLGSAHAVAPGHGKTVIAAYLVGQRGTKRQAFWLGATVTATHTAGVLLLGALLSLTSVAAPERFVPGTEVASGLLLGGVGVYLLRRAVRRTRAGAGLLPDHDHGHGSSGHDHDGPGHDHHDRPGHEHDSPGHDHAHDHDGPGHGHDDAHHDHAHHDHAQHGHPHHDHHAPGHGHRHDHDPHTPDHHGHGHDDHDEAREHDLDVLVGVGVGVAPAHDHSHAVEHDGTTAVLERPLVHTHGGHSHSHLPEDDAPLGWRTLATMGIAGGLVPSPSALVVLLGAAALGRAAFGALLVVGYGVGMALTLTVAGLLLLRARGLLDRRGWTGGRTSRALRLLPVLTAAIVLLVGAGVVLRGLITFHGLG